MPPSATAVGLSTIYDHRMAWVGRDLKDHQLQPLCCRQGCQPPYLILDQAAQGPIQPGLEHLQGWGIHKAHVVTDVRSFHYPINSRSESLSRSGKRTGQKHTYLSLCQSTYSELCCMFEQVMEQIAFCSQRCICMYFNISSV